MRSGGDRHQRVSFHRETHGVVSTPDLDTAASIVALDLHGMGSLQWDLPLATVIIDFHMFFNEKWS